MDLENIVERIKLIYGSEGVEEALQYALESVDLVEESQRDHIYIKIACFYNELGQEKLGREYAVKCAKVKPFTPIFRHSEGDPLILTLATMAASKVKIAGFSGYSIAEAHNNLINCLDPRYAKTSFYVDCLEESDQFLEHIKKPDMVICPISDPEECQEHLLLAKRVIDYLGVPFINDPMKVRGCTRTRLKERFGGWEHMIVPTTERIPLDQFTQEKADELLHRLSHGDGIIIRLTGFNQGHNLYHYKESDPVLFEEIKERAQRAGADLLATEFFELSFTTEGSDTKIYPKYRAFMGDGVLHPIHFFCSTTPFVNYQRPLPEEFEATRNARFEEYLTNPEGHIGAENWKTIGDLLTEVGLEYCGIDFAIYQGDVIVFEVNPGMQNTSLYENANPLAVEQWRKITRNIEDLIDRKIAENKK